MEEKDKKIGFKFIAIVLLIIIFILAAFRCFYHSGIKSNDNTSSIILVDSDDNLNLSWTINDNGNLVGNNLFDIHADVSIQVVNDYTFSYHTTDSIVNFSFKPDTQYTFSGYCCNLPGSTSNDRLMVRFTNGGSVNIATNYTENYEYFEYTSPVGYTIDSLRGTFGNSGGRGYIQYFMINEGSTPLEWEPYGVWYSQGNYDYINDQYEAISGQLNPLDVSHIIDHTEILNGTNITSEVGSSPLLSNINNGLGFYSYDFDGYSSWSSTSQNVIISTNKFNTVYTLQGCKAYSSLLHSQDDYYDFTFYLNNEIVFTYPDIDSETASDYMQNFETTNIQFDMIVFNIVITEDSANVRPGLNYFVATNNYVFGYQQGYRDGVDSQTDAVNNAFNNGVSYADSHVNENSSSYKVGYADGFEHGEDSSNYLKTTIFAIADTPLRVFKQIFSFDVLGINLAGIVLSVMSIFLVIWLFKKFH